MSDRSKRRRITENIDSEIVGDTAFLQELIDTFPAMSLVVDEDVTVVAFNATASRLLHIKADAVHQLTGQVISCANAINSPCGRGRRCKGCDLRLAVNSAHEGIPVERKRTSMTLVTDGKPREFHLLVTAKPYRRGHFTKVLLFIENITGQVTLQKLLPALQECALITEDEAYRRILDNYIDLHAVDPSE